MDLPIALGNVDSKLQHVSLTARMMWSLSHYGGPDTAYALYIAYLYFPSHLDILKNLYLNITSSLVDWNYCSGQSIFIDDNIKLWSSSAERKINLLDLISKSIQSGSDFIKKYNNSENYKNEITFLALNNFGEVTRYCNNSLYQVIDCQKSMMLDFKTEVYILLILGVGVLALCICAMVPFCYSTINYEDELWNNLRKKAYENYSELKQNLLERIKRVHCQPEILVNHRKPSNNKANFKSYYKYVWRISIYFIAVTAFSIANIAFLYEKCTDYLSYRPDIMKEMINRQILQNSIMTWTTLSQFETLGIPLVDEFVNLYPYMNSSSEFQKVLSLIEQSKVNLRNPKYLPILSDSFKNVFYKKDSYYIDYFNYGTSPGEELLLRESYFYAYSNLFPDLWIDWLIDFSILNTRYGELANEIDQHSQSVIEAQVNAIVATFVFFAASSIAIYFLLYFAFFKKEKECLGRISSIMKLMPNKN
ncbi:unnamed protein product [Blepharisma stoltei]|uniref:Uncharacterized protein n=1 Tax=Blepharisma stoltei TaxID=1481888 RepID=A0AAU9ID43_9CILI|nr:unnamed protein product [Blepharisma stoltei]